MKTIASKNNNESGFTMVELLVAIAIFGILTAIAIPNIITFKKNAQLGAATRELFSGFQQAKMNAIKRNSNCTITFNQNVNGTTYDYVVYVDADKDLEYDNGETVIASKLWDRSAEIRPPSFTFVNNDDSLPSITFTPEGLPYENDGSLGNGSITLNNTINTKIIDLSIVGNVKIAS